MSDVQILNINSEAARSALYGGSRPMVNKRTGEVQIVTARGLRVNSILRKDEWQEIDQAVVEAAKTRLVAVEHLRQRNLVQPLGGIGTLTSQWNVTSTLTAADVNMTGQALGERDLPDSLVKNVPVPVIFKQFAVGARVLDASRRLGDGIDVTGAYEAARVVAEMAETMLVNGYSLTFNGGTIYGYTTHTNRNTDTATNYGGGDWGTITNVLPTIAGMIAAANGDGYYGPFAVYAATTQYNQAALTYFTDGSGQTPAQRVLSLSNVALFEMCPTLADGVIVLAQLSRNVVDWAEAMPIQTLEWASGDGMVSHFKVMMVASPRVKADYSGNSGIVHATGA